MQARPRDDHTKRYVCAGRKPGHQLAIVADAADAVVAEHVLAILSSQEGRRALGRQGSATGDGQLGQALADLASAQARLRCLDDDYYVHGVLAESRYRPVKAKLEREIDRLRAIIDVATKERIILHPDPRTYWASADIVQRRELMRLAVTHVTIRPARRGVPRFDPTRVQVGLVPSLEGVVSLPASASWPGSG